MFPDPCINLRPHGSWRYKFIQSLKQCSFRPYLRMVALGASGGLLWIRQRTWEQVFERYPPISLITPCLPVSPIESQNLMIPVPPSNAPPPESLARLLGFLHHTFKPYQSEIKLKTINLQNMTDLMISGTCRDLRTLLAIEPLLSCDQQGILTLSGGRSKMEEGDEILPIQFHLSIKLPLMSSAEPISIAARIS